MIFSDRVPKMKKFGMSKYYGINRYKYDEKKKRGNKGPLVLRGAENFGHAKLREMQRYGTFKVREKEIIRDIKKGQAVIVEKEGSVIKAVVRYSTRYYYVVYDCEISRIKTFLPYDRTDFIECVQRLIDKENEMVEEKAA